MNTKKSAAMKFLDELVGTPQSFGDMLENIRECDELSQKEFAKKLKISPSHLCDIEKNRKVVSPERAARFAKILGYSQPIFVKYAIQAMLDQAGLKFKVELVAA